MQLALRLCLGANSVNAIALRKLAPGQIHPDVFPGQIQIFASYEKRRRFLYRAVMGFAYCCRAASPNHAPVLPIFAKLPLANATNNPHTDRMKMIARRRTIPFPAVALAPPRSSATLVTALRRHDRARPATPPVDYDNSRATPNTAPASNNSPAPCNDLAGSLMDRAAMTAVTPLKLPRNPALPSDLPPPTSDLSYLTPRPRCLTLAASVYP